MNFLFPSGRVDSRPQGRQAQRRIAGDLIQEKNSGQATSPLGSHKESCNRLRACGTLPAPHLWMSPVHWLSPGSLGSWKVRSEQAEIRPSGPDCQRGHSAVCVVASACNWFAIGVAMVWLRASLSPSFAGIVPHEESFPTANPLRLGQP